MGRLNMKIPAFSAGTLSSLLAAGPHAARNEISLLARRRGIA